MFGHRVAWCKVYAIQEEGRRRGTWCGGEIRHYEVAKEPPSRHLVQTLCGSQSGVVDITARSWYDLAIARDTRSWFRRTGHPTQRRRLSELLDGHCPVRTALEPTGPQCYHIHWYGGKERTRRGEKEEYRRVWTREHESTMVVQLSLLVM